MGYSKIVAMKQSLSSPLLKFIPKTTPNIAFIESLILGHITGSIWVEESKESPQSLLLLTKEEFGFVLGEPSKEILPDYAKLITNLESPKIYVSSKSEFIIKNSHIPRLNYVFNQNANLQDTDRQNIPHLEIVPIDGSNIDKCIWGKRVMGMYGSIANLEQNNIALCIVNNNNILAEAYSIIGSKSAEIGVVVHESHRGMGLATIICNSLINELQKRGLTIYWTCDQSNTSSVKAANKLGFSLIGPYDLYHDLKPRLTPSPRL